MKRIILLFLLLASRNCGYTQNKSLPKLQVENLNFIIVSDMGQRGISEQQNIADIMGYFAEQNKINFMAVAGDPINDNGVKSVTDEEWKLKFENIYTSPSLQKLPFYIVSGNHEYYGSVQAILDYSAVSERWNAPARYFSMECTIDTSLQKVLFIYLDTSPFIDKYRESDKYSDIREQNIEQQLYWLDSILVASTNKWKIVIGHHPVYANTDKAIKERTDMQTRVGEILENRGADFYICGHIHNFQHIKPENSKVHYVINSSASQSRKVEPIEGTIFCNADPGYSVFTISTDSVGFFFVNHLGETVYEYTIEK